MDRKHAPLLVLVGGFLGAGKTTLILKAAELLHGRGKRTAVILNDQDVGLVDTRHALAREVTAREVANGCFCCRFSEFIAAASDLLNSRPDVIFAEPVGSCVDLIAAVIRPVQALYGDRLRVAPFTVLLDRSTAERMRGDTLDANMQFLFTHQLAEADIVCTTKQDLMPGVPELPIPIDFHLSGRTGFGVPEWLNEVLMMKRVVGARLLDVDYVRYAEAEAALGWLNLHASVYLSSPLAPTLLCGPMLERIETALTDAGMAIAHVKVFDSTAGGWIKASICANHAEPVPEGDLLAEPAIYHELAINVRAVADPEQLRELVLSAVREITGSVVIRHLSAFRPPAPKPEYRMATSSLESSRSVAGRG